MEITVREFWKNIIDYPERLSYYDWTKNEGDVITDEDTKNMDAFIEENSDRDIVSFTISLKSKDIYISIK